MTRRNTVDADCVTGELGPREPFIHYYRKTFLEKKKKKKERHFWGWVPMWY